MTALDEAAGTPRPASLRRNVASLGAVLAANTLIPLITLPHMTRALGADSFGKLAYVQAVMAYALLFTDYAFSWSAVRDVAAVRDDKSRLSRMFHSVWAAQWLLTAIAGLVLALVAWFADVRGTTLALYALGFLAIVLGNTLFPLWFFQGLERIGEIALIQVVTRLLSIPAIFLLVKSPADAPTAMGIQAGVALMAGSCALLYLWRSGWVKAYAPGRADIIAALRTGFTLFLSKLGISFYTTLAPLALGLMAGTTAVSYFSLADRLRSAGQSLLSPLANALFPRLSHLYTSDHASATRLAHRGFLLTLAVASVISLGLFCLAGPAIRLLGGKEFGPAVDVLRVLALLPLIVGLSNVFGLQIMLPNGRTGAFNRILAGAAVLGVVAIWPMTNWLGAIGAAASVIGVELFVTCAMAFYLYRHPDLWRTK
jgi:O-antigen/teichoic acid export membrane protein